MIVVNTSANLYSQLRFSVGDLVLLRHAHACVSEVNQLASPLIAVIGEEVAEHARF